MMQKILRVRVGASRFWLLITNNTSTIICFPTHCCCWIFSWPCYSFQCVSAVFYKLWKIRLTQVIGRRQCSITLRVYLGVKGFVNDNIREYQIPLWIKHLAYVPNNWNELPSNSRRAQIRLRSFRHCRITPLLLVALPKQDIQLKSDGSSAECRLNECLAQFSQWTCVRHTAETFALCNPTANYWERLILHCVRATCLQHDTHTHIFKCYCLSFTGTSWLPIITIETPCLAMDLLSLSPPWL